MVQSYNFMQRKHDRKPNPMRVKGEKRVGLWKFCGPMHIPNFVFEK